MQLTKMAWRNIWRNTRRTVVTIGAMTLALTAMVLGSSMMQGMVTNMEQRIVQIELGDLQVFEPGYRNKPSIYTRIEHPQELVEELDQLGFTAAPRLLGGALAAAKQDSAGVSLYGIEPAQDAAVSEIYQQLESGDWLSTDDASGVVLGGRLAQTLGVQVGDEVVVLSQATDGSMANDLFFVRGILGSTGGATDRAGVFMTADAFRNFFILPSGAHQILVRRPEQTDLLAATNEAGQLAPGLEVKNWKQLMPTLATLIDSAQQSLSILIIIMYVVIAILILNATLMAVFERVREFGVLKAIGVSPGSVIRLILLEAGMQTGLALAFGLTLCAPALWYLTTYGIDTGALGGADMAGLTFASIWRAVVTPSTFVMPVMLLVIIVFIGVLYPAIKASRILPVEAMRYQ